MSSRASRRPQVQTPLSPLESLLLAQATWELGAGPNAWQGVAKLLSKHPLLSRPKSFFNAQVCHAEDLSSATFSPFYVHSRVMPCTSSS